MPDYTFEKQLIAKGFLRIAGVDEVGRGPWAGPVTAAAVVFKANNIPDGLDDSKRLSAAKRRDLAVKIKSAADWSVVHVDVSEIDQMNILKASMVAMSRAISLLEACPNHVLVDGNRVPNDLLCPATALIKGDGRSSSIAAASILAKVTRDQLMWDLAGKYPHYGWETNAGYGTKRHQEGLKSHGVTPHHRRSFKPIHNMLCQDELLTH